MIGQFGSGTSMQRRAVVSSLSFILFLSLFLLQQQAHAGSCANAVHELNARLSPKIDEQELVEVLQSLNNTADKETAPCLRDKTTGQVAGVEAGRDLWSVRTLRGSSMGGDRFRNREGRLPDKNWREADLDYKGGHRGSKRLIFSRDGDRFVTVDHYRTFVEVPPCR